MFYKHYKTKGLYIKLFTALSAETTPIKRVIYMQLYKSENNKVFTIWDKPESEFNEEKISLFYIDKKRKSCILKKYKKLSLRELFLYLIGKGNLITNEKIIDEVDFKW